MMTKMSLKNYHQEATEAMEATVEAPKRHARWAFGVSSKYNDPDWVVVTDRLPKLQADFEESILLQLRDMPGGPLVSAEDARKKGTEAHAKLMQVRH